MKILRKFYHEPTRTNTKNEKISNKSSCAYRRYEFGVPKVRLFVWFVLSLLFFVVCIFFLSCEKEDHVLFPVYGTASAFLSRSQPAREGLLDFSKQKKFEYKFDKSFSVPENSSMEIEYEINGDTAASGSYSVVLSMGSVSWRLPADIDCVRYAVPVHDTFDGNFYIAVEITGKTGKKDLPLIKIDSIGFKDRFFGFVTNTDNFDLYTPFLTAYDDGSYKIDVPPAFMPKGRFAQIEARLSGERKVVLELANKKIETYKGIDFLFVPPALFTQGTASLSLETPSAVKEVYSFLLSPRAPYFFPEPIKTDPAFLLYWSKERWRNKSFEIFRWDRFPSLLIFDFADYAVQDKMLKRLAFFVEKAGFRGRLAPDSEIEELHAWNAHDYRALDLAAFFDAAKKANFPLLDEEKQLEKILLGEGIILEASGKITAGEGGIVSISRESSDYLRYRFLTHEGFHGLFFIDADFRDFSRKRLEKLPAAAKRFIVSYFAYQQYDTKDEYLLINEFMAHILQQSDSQAAEYFGHYLPLRLLESSWRASTLPPKDEASNTWPALSEAFAVEGEAFSDYVNKRWGLAGGRVWGLQIKDK
jgi:hypothetical protein